MSALRRAVNLTIALVLVALGGGGLVYFYFIEARTLAYKLLDAETATRDDR